MSGTGIGTRILPCDCKVPFQDTEYGAGLRVHNRMGGKDKGEGKKTEKGWRCTGCAKTKDVR